MEKVLPLPVATVTASTDNLIPVSTHKRVWGKSKRKIATIFLTISGVLSILLLIFIVLFVITKVHYDKLSKNTLCTSEDCIATAKTLLDTMDTGQDPCQDFYAYACGNFRDEHPLPEGAVYRSWFEEGEEKLSRMVQTVVEQEHDKDSMRSLKKARDFYNSCLNTNKLEEIKFESLYKLLKLLNLPSFPDRTTADSFNLGKTLGLLQRHLNMDTVVQIGFDKGAIRPGEDNDTFILQISPVQQLGESSIILSAIRRDPDTLSMSSAISAQAMLQLRLNFMANIMNAILLDLEAGGHLHDKNETADTTSQAFKILTFTVTMNEAVTSASALNDSSKTNVETMTFSALQESLDNLVPSADGAGNRIVWKDLLEGMFYGDTGYWAYDYEEDLVSVQAVQSLQALARFLAANQVVTIQRYVWWSVVSEYARYTTDDMEEIYKKLHEAILGKSGGTSREKTCVGYVRKFFPIAIAKEIRSAFNFTENTSKIAEMLNDIVYEFEILVDAVSWMDRHTKDLNIAKAKAVKNMIGYDDAILNYRMVEDYYEELSIADDELLLNIASLHSWDLQKSLKILKQSNDSILGPLADVTNPLQVNAYYARTSNAIYVPAGILQRPFYYKGLESLNYGAIGSILGHELTHGFDSEGKNYDRYGKVRQQIWSPEITEQFKQRAQCFVEQYSTYNVTQHTRLDGVFTLAENIADNGGIRESYYAYQTYIKRHGIEPKLPGFEHFSHEQLLFLSFATIWCETNTERYRELASKDNHSPNKVRVLASLQNMEPFARAFSCPAGSFMNPRKKCIIW